MSANTTEGFLENLLVSPTSNNWKNPRWICHLINRDPDLGQQFINNRLREMVTYAERMEFLIGIKVCIKFAIKDLENYLKDERYPVSCCPSSAVWDAENSICHFQSALLKITSAICYENDCSKIPCESKPKTKYPNLTPHQWTLAFHIFFKVLGFDTSSGNQINQVLLARFMHLVTGENCPEKVINSKYLGYLKTAPDFNRAEGSVQTVTDLEVVRVHFEQVGIMDALPLIDTMIKQYHKPRKTKQA